MLNIKLSSTTKLIIILALSVALRVAVALFLGNSVVALPGTADQVSYHNLALRVLGGHGFSFGEAWWPVTGANEPTAHWSFLYTLYLSAVYFVFGPHPLAARLIQAVAIGLLHPYLAYRLAGLVFRAEHWPERVRENIPLLAAGITAVYVYFVYYTVTLMTEAFFIPGLLACLTLLIALSKQIAGSGYWKQAIWFGLALSATVLLRQLFLLIIPFLLLWLWVAGYQRGLLKRGVASSVVALGILALSILPFTIYNASRFDRFVLLNTNAGYAFFWANHPIYGTQFIDAADMGDTYQKLVPAELRHLDEAALDQELLSIGIQFVQDDPVRYAKLSLSRIPSYFKFWPDSRSGLMSNVSRVASFALFLPFMVAGLLASIVKVSNRRKDGTHWWMPLILLYLVLFIYTAIHILTWAQIRYRMPIDAILVVFAALAFGELIPVVARLFKRGKDRVNDYGQSKYEETASS